MERVGGCIDRGGSMPAQARRVVSIPIFLLLERVGNSMLLGPVRCALPRSYRLILSSLNARLRYMIPSYVLSRKRASCPQHGFPRTLHDSLAIFPKERACEIILKCTEPRRKLL